MKKIYLDYEDYGIALSNLVKQIKRSRLKFNGVYGVPRGGAAIALHMSHNLNIPVLLYPTKDSLVVDDISDTGKTLMSHKNKKIATLYTTPWTKTKPDFSVLKKLEKDSWIIFPWEI